MGIIENQGIKGTIYSYVGVAVGFVTAGILMPNLLDQDEIGVLEMLVTWASIFATLATLGINSVSNRLFPYFRNPKTNHNGYFSILSIVLVLGLTLSIGLFLILKPLIIRDSLDDSQLFINYIDLIIPLMIFTAVFMVVDIYYAVLYNAVKGLFLKDFLQRLFVLAVLLVFYFKVFDFSGLVMAYVGALSLPGILILMSLTRDGEFVFKSPRAVLTSDLTKSMASVAVFGIAVTFGNSLIQYVDRIMINSILGVADVGFYRVMFFYGTLVIIPLRPLSKISAVVVAQSWKDNKKEEVLSVYRKSTIDQLLVGLLVFVGIWGNIDNVLHMIPDEYGGGKFVVFFIGLSNVFVMAAGVSGAIISTSPRYKVLTVFIVIFGLLVVATNLIFIKLFGIVGAAAASAISVFAYSLMRVIFLMKRYKMQPFSLRHLVILFIGVGVYLLSMLIPDLYNENSKYLTLALDIIVRSGMITIVYVGLVYLFKLSPDLERFVGKLVKRIRS